MSDPPQTLFNLICCIVPFLVTFLISQTLGKGKKIRGPVGEQLSKISKTLKGNIGELVLIGFLKSLNTSDYKVINNITLKVNDLYTQIDHIVVSQFGIFVIETKVRAGSVYGNATSKIWMQYLKGSAYQFQNPIHQNFRHTQAIKTIFRDKFELNPISIVAFSGDTDIHLYKNNTNSIVVRLSQVVEKIHEFVRPQRSIADRDFIYETLRELKVKGELLEEAHLQYLRKINHTS